MLWLILICFLPVNGGPPVFNDDPWNITANQNVLLRVRCSATGDPEPTYGWFNEHAREVGPHLNPPIWVERDGAGAQLVFNLTSKAHSGGYTCVAKNFHGLRSKVYEVNIIGEESSIKVLKVADTSVTFGLVASDEIYDLKYRESYQNLTYYSQFTGKDTTLKIGNLIPSGRYSFNFSRKGDEEWTLNLTVVLLPAKPEVIFHKLNDGMLIFSWFKIFDDFMRKTIDKYHLTYTSVRQVGGRTWEHNNCNISIEIPVCANSQYTLANLYKNQWYEINFKAHTPAGYGEPFRNKIYVT